MALVTRHPHRHIVFQSPIAFGHTRGEVADTPSPPWANDTLALSDDVLRLAFDQLPIGIAVCGLDGRLTRTNRSCRSMFGFDDAEPVGQSTRDPAHTDDLLLDQDFVDAALAGERMSMERDKRYTRVDGSTVWARELTQLVRDSEGRALYFVSFLQDLTERQRSEEMLHKSEQTLRAVIDNTPSTISVKDRAHRYTLVNRDFEEKHHTRGSRILGRPDVDVLPAEEIADVHRRDREIFDTGATTQQEKVAMRNGAEQVLLVTRFPLRDEMGVIAGVCTASTDVTDRRRSERLSRERLECSAMIYSAIAEDRLVLHAQPIRSLASMRSVTAEILIRMQPPGAPGELLAPAAFLPDAERFGLIGVIDEWVVRQAMALASEGHQVSVNLSAKTVSDPEQVSQIEARVAAIGAASSMLIFEITETAIAEDLDSARSFSTRMRAHGASISLDDFGVGHGSFTYLRHLPVDYLKIDAQFVRRLLTDDEDNQVVQAIIGVARHFNIKTVAEGVEEQATLDALRALGADYVQGYLTGRPMPLAECWESQINDASGDTDVRYD